MTQQPLLLPFALVDAFTLDGDSVAIGLGNPAAVIALPAAPATASPNGNRKHHITFPNGPDTEAGITALCQRIAAEMNQSETAFVQPIAVSGAQQQQQQQRHPVPQFAIRWFSPTTEVPLCVHASLAASHTLVAVIGICGRDTTSSSSPSLFSFDLHTINGRVLRVTANPKTFSYTLSVPNNKPFLCTAENDPYSVTVSNAVVATCRISKSDIRNVFYNAPTKKYLVELNTPEDVADKLQVDIPGLHAALDKKYVASVSFTAQVANPRKGKRKMMWNGAVAVSAHFAPWVGIPQDPVTGAAHTLICPVFAERLKLKDDDEAIFFQVHPGRGGVLRAKVRRDHVLMTGRGHTVVSGNLHLSRGDVALATASAAAVSAVKSSKL